MLVCSYFENWVVIIEDLESTGTWHPFLLFLAWYGLYLRPRYVTFWSYFYSNFHRPVHPYEKSNFSSDNQLSTSNPFLNIRVNIKVLPLTHSLWEYFFWGRSFLLFPSILTSSWMEMFALIMHSCLLDSVDQGQQTHCVFVDFCGDLSCLKWHFSVSVAAILKLKLEKDPFTPL